ncbi:hypothetical protein F5Y17DRAFT_337350 [Xylariaceae sp. FL0594]|nr:hypothetical protein F5Y17DRAFT_337350 [Xylariaceae sp. FL0594]
MTLGIPQCLNRYLSKKEKKNSRQQSGQKVKFHSSPTAQSMEESIVLWSKHKGNIMMKEKQPDCLTRWDSLKYTTLSPGGREAASSQLEIYPKEKWRRESFSSNPISKKKKKKSGLLFGSFFNSFQRLALYIFILPSLFFRTTCSYTLFTRPRV